MKRAISILVISTLCLVFALPAFADTTVNVETLGDDSPVAVVIGNNNVTNANGSGFHDNDTGAGAPSFSPGGKGGTVVIVNGEKYAPPARRSFSPEDCGERYARESKNKAIKREASTTIEYLRIRLRQIGWAYDRLKIIRSREVRVIYGAKGSNTSKSRTPTHFYYEADPDICVDGYMVVLWSSVGRHGVFFTSEFRTGDAADLYDADWLYTSRGQGGTAAVDEFIDYLQSLSDE